MSDPTTVFPHQELLASKNLTVEQLPEKLQNKVKRVLDETDKAKQDDLELALYGLIDDFIAEKEEAEKKAKIKAKMEAEKKKKTDVSGAPTATNASASATKPDDERPFMSRLFNRD